MSLADKIEQSLKVTKKHKPQRAVKGTLCRSFSLDGNLFIEKFDLVQGTESMQNRNFRAKTAVKLNTLSEKCYSKYMVKHCILRGKKFKQYHTHLQKILSEVTRS